MTTALKEILDEICKVCPVTGRCSNLEKNIQTSNCPRFVTESSIKKVLEEVRTYKIYCLSTDFEFESGYTKRQINLETKIKEILGEEK